MNLCAPITSLILKWDLYRYFDCNVFDQSENPSEATSWFHSKIAKNNGDCNISLIYEPLSKY